MNTKTLYNLVVIIAGLAILPSCAKYLEKEPDNRRR
jgi:hypothetical protein